MSTRDTKSNNDKQTDNRYAVLSLSCVSMLACILLWAGCGTPEEKYKILSFWFDGVPDPNAVITGPGGKPILASATMYQHKPFKDGDCAGCHDSFSNIYISNKSSNVCLKCHEDKVNEYPKMHGPVATVACLWCHSPHESPNKYLLRYESPEVCVQCHERGKLLGNKPPEHMDPLRNCLDCHVGHGSEKRYFLRENAPPVILDDQLPQYNTENIPNTPDNNPDDSQIENPVQLPTENPAADDNNNIDNNPDIKPQADDIDKPQLIDSEPNTHNKNNSENTSSATAAEGL